MAIRILVTGSRDWDNRVVMHSAFQAVINEHGPITALGHGACRGADILGSGVALLEFGLPWDAVYSYPANWYPMGRMDRSAGPRRNRAMYADFKPDLVLAFSDNITRPHSGTADMIAVAVKGGTPVWLFDSSGHRTIL